MESPKRTIFVSGGLRWLQTVLEPNTGRCKALDGVGLDLVHSRHVLKL